ncbi:Glycosyltransferase involved in cell wall bisynthesis [Malonomonas rubra DSM 5091]|uniref:Glycosyltransferase involved in cell wall bisynthesis n=1 Tax=Malonomonas rubra DSM 5091 TaxID=1122189 RepID=A0A1M6DRL7_MALRU|nr:glycosyltransferase [Malonomonas rubra]SHI75759.1 Glycosyltransferase involved in cell wall bisynthesis [Malonomonas rubra DSM 5091]
MKSIFVIGAAASPLTRERGQVPLYSGYELHWYSPSGDDVPGAKMYRYPFNRLKQSTFIEMFYVFYLILKIRPVIVHVFYANQRFVNLAATFARKLVVTVMGSDIADYKLGYRFNSFFVQWLLSRADVVTSKSIYLDSRLASLGVDIKKIKRITWGVDRSRFAPDLDTYSLRVKYGIAEGDFVVFDVRSCSELYNHPFILRSFATYLETYNIDAVLILTRFSGSVEYINKLEALIRHLGIVDNVRFVDAIPKEEMPLYYNLADVVVSVPSSDGMPQSLYESMACGCFHILGDLPQYKELIRDRVNGLFVEIGNEQQLVEALDWVSKNQGQLTAAAQENQALVHEIADRDQQFHKMTKIYDNLLHTNTLENQ